MPSSATVETTRYDQEAHTGEALVRTVTTELTGSLNSRRTIRRLLHLVTLDLADWAMLALIDSRSEGFTLVGGRDTERAARVRRDAIGAEAVDRVLISGQPELLHIGLDDPEADLRELIPDPELAEEAAAFRPSDVLVTPLIARGVQVGALLLLRGGERGFDAGDVEIACRVGVAVAVALDSARLYEERARVSEILEASLRPPALPSFPTLEIAGTWRPSVEHLDIGGDFYDVHGPEEDCLVILGDVCGKGVDAAVLNGRARQTLRTAALFTKQPSAVLTALNSALFSAQSTRFVTAVVSRVRSAGDGTWRVEVSVAGHESPFVVRADGRIEQIAVSGPLSGVYPDVGPYDEATVELREGDTLLMYSDGITEARAADGSRYGIERLHAIASQYAGLAPAILCQAVEQDVVDRVAGRGHDDMTVLALGPRG